MKRILLRFAIFLYGSFLNALSYISPQTAANIALYLFRKPRSGKLRAHQKEFLNNSVQKRFQSNGYSIVYYNWPGTGSRILLVHGWESNSARWKPYIKELQKRSFDIYAVDAPAHGGSGSRIFSPELYMDAIDHIVKDHKINFLLGHSVGAYSCLMYAHLRSRPDSLTHLILLAPNGKLRNILDQFFDLLKLNERLRKAYIQNFIRIYKEAPERFDSNLMIQGIGLKGLLIHDRYDHTLDYEESVLIARNWPDAEFHITEGYGHRLKSTEVKDILFNYIDSVDQANESTMDLTTL